MGLVKTLLQKGYMVTIVAEEDRYSNIFKKIGCRFINLSIILIKTRFKIFF